MCVYADSVLCVGQVKDISGAVERWKEQVEGLRLYSSYQDAVGIDEDAMEFEWNIRVENFPRSFVIVHSGRNPTRLGGAEIQPEEFTDRILFMSMFNDIVRNTNDENYVWNAEKVKNYAMRFS